MSRSPLRAMAAALDDAALEALASKGLVRRALADVAAGKAALDQEEPGSARIAVDGETVTLAAAGLKASGCSCPAPGICRHRLAAAIALRSDPDVQPDEGPAHEWSAVIGAIGLDAIARFAGKAGWREAQARAAVDAQVEVGVSRLTVTLVPGEAPVVFLPAGGLEAAIARAPERERKTVVAAAVLAARRALGLPAPAEAESQPKVETPARESLDPVRAFLARCIDVGLAAASPTLEAEALRLALASRIEAAPRMAGLLRRIAGALASLRGREADADSGAVLSLLAEAYGLCVALEQADPRLQADLAGQVRQSYERVRDLELMGLGARLWAAPSGALGVTAHFLAPSLERTLSLSLARPDRADAWFDPRAAFRQSPVWGSTLEALSQSRVEAQGLQVSASNRLSASASIEARLEPLAARRDTISRWPCAFSDWRVLEAALQSLLAPRLAQREPEIPVVLVFARQGQARFDELTQTLTWPLADDHGRWIGVSLDYAGPERDRLDVLERLTRAERSWAVLATAETLQGRIELRPYALWGATLRLLDFPPPAERATAGPDGLLERLRRLAGRPADGSHLALPSRSATDRLLDRLWNALLRRAELGQAAGAQALAVDLAGLAAELEVAGLGLLARQIRAAANPDTILAAAFALEACRVSLARLAWMS